MSQLIGDSTAQNSYSNSSVWSCHKLHSWMCRNQLHTTFSNLLVQPWIVLQNQVKRHSHMLILLFIKWSWQFPCGRGHLFTKIKIDPPYKILSYFVCWSKSLVQKIWMATAMINSWEKDNMRPTKWKANCGVVHLVLVCPHVLALPFLL